jgi:hypothetical protein
MPDHAVSGSYHVSVNAPGDAPAPPREWLVRTFDVAAARRGELLASCSHENLEVAADHVFREIRADIDERLTPRRPRARHRRLVARRRRRRRAPLRRGAARACCVQRCAKSRTLSFAIRPSGWCQTTPSMPRSPSSTAPLRQEEPMAELADLDRQQAGEPARRLRRGPVAPEVIGPPACPIMHRWTLLNVRGGKLMLHHFLPNADDRAEHDHPAPFWTFVLWGGYDDRVPCPACGGCQRVDDPQLVARWAAQPPYDEDDDNRLMRWQCWMPCPTCHTPDRGPTGEVPGDRMRAGMLRRRAAAYRHRTRVLPSGAWTLVYMGRKERPWGFWKDGRWWPWREHEKAFGFGMRCPTDDDHG